MNPRYKRDDYSACDWRRSKSDILRDKKYMEKMQRQRRYNLANALGIVALLVVLGITVAQFWR